MSRLDRIKDWEERAKSARYDAAELARLCEVSYSQLRRYFVGAVGKSPQAFLNEVRLREAARLVCSTTLLIKEIASMLNFGGESHFCRAFKAYFGCRPSEFSRGSPNLGMEDPKATPVTQPP